ncbi:uncharacterized protein RHOBADRAFT_50525 [Rhodotorula graminis WP1]|uniref:Uncharacterized protein n=1 Tax=Rhodotorula graminis (strain WP1) TaxID=578459 RepID=A0A194SBM5_RHOGW|nr:uncharacterized protein RHOBADRAFT_50525 [Rhodotorula graminis WP1]KPV78002.1 hypothetical protein RHOBADRAFT_50525 [Rhodotorula graminis WP1]
MAKRKAAQTAPAPAAPTAKPPAKKARFSNPPPPPPAASSSTPRAKPKQKGKAAASTAAASAPGAVKNPAAPKRFTVAAGSYERLLYGLECTFEPATGTGTDFELSISPIFSFPAHLSSLRTVAASTLTHEGTGSERRVGGKYLVSGGSDEIIKVWDLPRRKEVGSLEGDTIGTITCMRFVPQRNMLAVASTDSTIALYRVRDWILLRSLKGHKGRVNSFDAHPDGRVALSVGVDKMLRMWDLVAGKSVTAMRLGGEGDVVRWNTNGSKFAVICGSDLTVYGLDMSIHHLLTAKSRFHDVRFCYFPLDATDPNQREYLLVACEDGKVRVFDVSNPNPITIDEDTDLDEVDLPYLDPVALFSGHSNRVKQMDLLEVALPTAEPSSTMVLTTVSSDGKINMYDLARLPRDAPVAEDKGKGKKATKPASAPVPADKLPEVLPSATFDTDKTRLTCVTAIGIVEKRARTAGADGEAQQEEESSSEDDEEGSDEEELSGEDGSELEVEGESEDEDEEEEEFEGIEEED